MKSDSRYIVKGAAAGAVLGALAGWVVSQRGAPRLSDGKLAVRSDFHFEKGQLMRLGGTIVALVRQIIDLG